MLISQYALDYFLNLCYKYVDLQWTCVHLRVVLEEDSPESPSYKTLRQAPLRGAERGEDCGTTHSYTSSFVSLPGYLNLDKISGS